jgi:hypothetical protein
MAENVSKFLIEFESSGSKELKDQLNSLAAAINSLSRTQKKLVIDGKETIKNKKKVSQAAIRLTAKVKSQGKSWKQLGIDVQTLKRAYAGSITAQRKMADTLKKTNRHSRILGGSFAVLRSKLLLFNFAMAMGIRQLMRFTKEAAKVESMERAFNSLTGATGSSSLALQRLKEATNGTMSEFDLFQQANNAMILGVSKNSEEMAEMFDIAQRLGRALGRDTKSSVESLITGIGRQSRLMLDNIGIITKVDDANKKYARQLKKNVSQLTDSERRQAFLNATMEAAREKVATLGDETETTQDKIDTFDAAMSDLSANMGQALGVAFLPLMRAMVKLSEVMNPERIRAYSTVIVGLAVAMGLYVGKLKQAVLWQTRLGWGALATLAGVVATEVLLMTGIFDDAEEKIDLTAQKTEALAQSLLKLSLAELIHQQQVLNSIVSDSFNPFADQIALIDKYISILEKGFSNIENFNDALRQSEELYKKTPQAQKELIQAQIKMIENLIKVGGETKELVAVLEMLEGKLLKISTISPEMQHTIDMWGQYNSAITNVTDSFEQMRLQSIENDRQGELSVANNIRNERKRQQKIDEINKKYDKKAKEQKEAMKAVKVAEAISNTALAVTKVLDKPWLAALVAIQGALQVSTIQAQKYEYGGLVGGRRHSQGGTVIEAERGEFVMSRRAVDAIGLETMNRINQGGSAGGVNISFNGNVMSKDFIEDEAIPQIKEAIRRGADIGVG